MIKNEEAETKITCCPSVRKINSVTGQRVERPTTTPLTVSQNTNVIIVLFFVSCSLMFYSCKKNNPVSPPDHTNGQQDTTSHDISWKIWTFSNPGIEPHLFRDVFALSDTDVWVVGDIYRKLIDSAQQKYLSINAVHWNGREWKEYSIPSKLPGGPPLIIDHLYSVYATSASDWWFCSQQSITHWDGTTYTPFYVDARRGLLLKTWGRFWNDLYISGTNGSLTHFDGITFQLIETGTSIYLLDVCGTADGIVWTGGLQNWDWSHAFLQLQDGKFTSLERTKDIKGVSCMWASRDTLYANVSSGVYIQSINDTSKWRLLPWRGTVYPLGWVRGLRGSADSNIFVVGDFGTIIHYNGKSWHLYDFFDLNKSLQFWAVSVLPKKVYAVGIAENNQAVIYEGTMR
jgi:hypothetical protein